MKAARIAWITLAACLGGCSVGPDYQIPDVFTPPAFTGRSSGKSSFQERDDVAQITQWWTLFRDPEITSLVQRAASANSDINVARAHLLAARENEVALRGYALPSVEASAGGGRGTGNNSAKGRISSSLNAATSTQGLSEITYVAGFDAGWELDLFGKNRRLLEAASDLTDVAREQKHAILVSVVSDVVRSYVETRTIQEKIRISRENISRAEKTRDLAKTRFDRGLTNELDVSLAKRQLETLRAQIGPLLGEEFATCARIALLTGAYSGPVCGELKAGGRIPATPARIITGIPADIIRRRPDVRAAERAVAAADAEIGVAVANLFPRVAVTTGGGLEGQGLGVLPLVTKSIYSVGPALYWPVLDFGALDAAVKVRELAADEKMIEYKRVVMASVEEANIAVTRYQAAMSTLTALTAASKASRHAVELAFERYERGVTDFLNVLDAERQEYELSLQFAQAKSDAAKEFIAIYKALGGGWEMFDDPDPELPTPRPAILAAVRSLDLHH